MKKVLILGGSHSELPLILEAKKLNFFVYSLGNKEDIGHKFSNSFIKEDFSDYKKVLKIVKKEKIDFIIAGCNDFSIKTASYINEILGKNFYDSFEITNLIHNKNSFKKLAKKLNINTPKENKNFPLIIKPIDLSGGKGVRIIHNESELKKTINHITKISKEKKYILEEYIKGEHFSYFTFIYNQKILIEFSAKEYFYKNPFLVQGAYSYKLDENIKNILRNWTYKLITNLNLKDGIIHYQFILKDNIPYVLEITRRCPGDLYLKLIDYSLNINISELIIKLYTNIPIKFSNNIEKNKIIRHCLMTDKNGIFKSVEFKKNLDIIEYFPLKTAGENIQNYLNEKIGILFAKYKDKKNINNIIKIEVEND